MESHDDQSDHQGIVNLQERRRAVLLDRLAVLAAREPDIMEKIEAAATLESIGGTIRRIVTERGLTPYAVAKLAGKRNFTDIREFLRGERDVKLSTVEAICRGLGLTLQPDAPPEPKPRAAGRNRAKGNGRKPKSPKAKTNNTVQVPEDEDFDNPIVAAALDYDGDLSYNLTQSGEDDQPDPQPVANQARSNRMHSGKRNGRIRVKRDEITPDHDATNLTE